MDRQGSVLCRVIEIFLISCLFLKWEKILLRKWCLSVFLWPDKPKPKIYHTTKSWEWFSNTSKIRKLEIWSLPRSRDYDEKAILKGIQMAIYHSRIDNFPSKVPKANSQPSKMCFLGLIEYWNHMEVHRTRHYRRRFITWALETILLSCGHRMLKS